MLRAKTGGAEGIRTPDPHNAIVVLYQLSYDPSQSEGNLKGCSGLSKRIFGSEVFAPRRGAQFASCIGALQFARTHPVFASELMIKISNNADVPLFFFKTERQRLS
jgi:hypothetical protein